MRVVPKINNIPKTRGVKKVNSINYEDLPFYFGTMEQVREYCKTLTNGERQVLISLDNNGDICLSNGDGTMKIIEGHYVNVEVSDIRENLQNILKTIANHTKQLSNHTEQLSSHTEQLSNHAQEIENLKNKETIGVQLVDDTTLEKYSLGINNGLLYYRKVVE